MYSRVLGHVQLSIRPHFHRVVNPSILPPSSPLPPVESDEVQGEGVSCTDLGWVRDMNMDTYIYVYILALETPAYPLATFYTFAST